MFQFTRLARESRDHCLFVSYPRLIADLHAFHRLLMPRHPPYTLNSLTTNIQLFQRVNPKANSVKRTFNCACIQATYNDINLIQSFDTQMLRTKSATTRYSRVVFTMTISAGLLQHQWPSYRCHLLHKQIVKDQCDSGSSNLRSQMTEVTSHR